MVDGKDLKTGCSVETRSGWVGALSGSKLSKGACRRGGFTIIEMLTVLAIIAILSSIAAITATGSIDRMKADMTARTIAFALNKARIRAITENNNYVVSFVTRDTGSKDKSGYIIEIHDDNNRNGIKDTGEKVEEEHLTKGVPFDLPEGKDIYCTSPTSSSMRDGIVFPNNKVTFYPRGNASDSGEIYIYPLTSKEKGRNWNRRAVSLEKVTGKPVIWFFDKEKDKSGKCPWTRK
jgi:prepilin-type N-terminal cleavage/methylation domain-containing protein